MSELKDPLAGVLRSQRYREYTRQRQAFGQSIVNNQYVHFRLAELKTEVESLKALVYQDEAGAVWLDRMLSQYRSAAWLNPTPKNSWGHVRSINMINDLMEGRMFPLTVNGIDDMTRELSR